MFNRFKEMILRFMYGRYGNDSLNNFLFWTYIVITCINIFIGSYILYLLATVAAVYMFFRMFSRNIYARQRENTKFWNFKNRFTGFFSTYKKRYSERKTHIYKKCPHCKATLRLPRKKGKHTCNCPRCFKSFQVKVY